MRAGPPLARRSWHESGPIHHDGFGGDGACGSGLPRCFRVVCPIQHLHKRLRQSSCAQSCSGLCLQLRRSGDCRQYSRINKCNSQTDTNGGRRSLWSGLRFPVPSDLLSWKSIVTREQRLTDRNGHSKGFQTQLDECPHAPKKKSNSQDSSNPIIQLEPLKREMCSLFLQLKTRYVHGCLFHCYLMLPSRFGGMSCDRQRKVRLLKNVTSIYAQLPFSQTPFKKIQ